MRNVAWGLLIIWVIVYAASFIIPFSYEATGDGFTRGLNRVAAFFGWQFAAGLIALIVWGLKDNLGEGRKFKWIGRIPILLALALFLLCVAAILWARFAKSPPTDYVPPQNPTHTAEPINPEPQQ